MLPALLEFTCWEAALFAAAIVLAGKTGRRGAERWLLVLAIELTLESSLAALFSFTGINSRAAYWGAAAVCAAGAYLFRSRRPAWRLPRRLVRGAAVVPAALLAPLVLLSFHPVEEIDSINYLHYLIEWMANRSTPYDFATYYVAFWELSFLPAWTVTRLDGFFPLLALKALVLLALAAWLLGRELRIRALLLALVVFSGCLLRHLWYAASGVSTLKNDTLAGVGFLLLALVAMRAARRPLRFADAALLAFGIVFAPVKYLGMFLVPVALAIVLWFRYRQVSVRAVAAMGLLALATSWHYYLHHLLKWGSPFYPVQINLGPIHLPGLADLSDTSILYNLRNPEVWRLFFVPASGVSVGGMMFPLVLAATLVVTGVLAARAVFEWLRRRAAPAPRDVAALLVLFGWLLYFRSALGAGGSAGDLRFLRGDLNTLRYAIGPLLAGELLLAALLPRLAWFWAGANLASRLALLYVHIPLALFPLPVILAAAAVAALAALRPRVCLAALVIACPLVVERNRALWTPYWNDLKPALAAVRERGLAILALPEGGYFAGQAVAAGNPVHPEVRALLSEQVDALAPAQRPPYLAVLFSPGSEGEAVWRARHAGEFARWGYRTVKDGSFGLLLALPPAGEHAVVADRPVRIGRRGDTVDLQRWVAVSDARRQ